nr:hypothetical protein [Tanacetum cinerariifolium]
DSDAVFAAHNLEKRRQGQSSGNDPSNYEFDYEF